MKRYAQDGVRFERVEGGDVIVSVDAVPNTPAEVVDPQLAVEARIPANLWARIVAQMTVKGEIEPTYQAALKLHQEGV